MKGHKSFGLTCILIALVLGIPGILQLASFTGEPWFNWAQAASTVWACLWLGIAGIVLWRV